MVLSNSLLGAGLATIHSPAPLHHRGRRVETGSTMRRLLLAATLLFGVGAAAAVAAHYRPIRFEIAHRSMSPVLDPGDYVVAVRWSTLRRGDIVIVPHPGRTGFDLVKRVIGLPGETLEIMAAGIAIDGTPLDDRWGYGATRPDGTAQLAADEIYVLGDQRPVSTDDSRSLGPIPLGEARHRVEFVYWPLPRMGRVSRDPAAAHG